MVSLSYWDSLNEKQDKIPPKKIKAGDLWQEDEDGRQREEDGRRAKDTKAKGCDEASNRNEEKLGKKRGREEGQVLLSAQRQKWMNPIGLLQPLISTPS